MTLLRAGSRSVGGWLWVEEEDYKWLALIAGVALAVRVVWVVVFQTPPGDDASAFDNLAWRLANGQGYVDADGNPTAFWPVGYPAFLAAVYIVFGHSWTVAGIANALLGSLSVLLTYRLAREVISSRAALVSAGAVALLPSHIIAYTSVLRTETFHTTLTLTALIAATGLARHPNWRNAALLGLILGIGVYVRPILLLFPVVVALLNMIRGEVGFRKSVGLAGIALLISLLTISPWTVRNFFAMGAFVPTSTNGGYTFYIANGPDATGEYPPEASCIACKRMVHADLEPRTGLDEFYYYSDLEQHRQGYRLGLEYIVAHPGQWLTLLPVKFFHVWASDRYHIGYGVVGEQYADFVPALWVVAQGYWTVLVVAAGAAAVSRSICGYWLRYPALLFPMTLVYWAAFHLFTHGEGRFHAQMIPVVAIISAHLLEQGRDWRAWLPAEWRGVSG